MISLGLTGMSLSGLRRGGNEYDFTSTLPSAVSFSRDGAGTATASSGLVVAFPSGVARIVDRGLLLEAASTNFQYNADGLATDLYSLLSGALSSGNVAGTAPDGGGTVRRLQVTVDATLRFGETNSGTAGTTYCASVWLRTRDGSTKSGLLDVNDNASTAPSIGPGWTRFSATGVQPAEIWRFYDLTLPVGDYEIWGCQNEAAPAPSSLIFTPPTLPATRGVDVATMTVPVGCKSYRATYNGGVVAAGSATAGATFDLVTGRPWLGGYLQRIEFA